MAVEDAGQFSSEAMGTPAELFTVQHGERTLYKSDWVRLTRVDITPPDGHRFEHHVVRLQRVAMTLVVDELDRVLMLWRYRFPVNAWGWEIPGGIVAADEEAAVMAERECVEETGWKPGPLVKLAEFQPMPGMVLTQNGDTETTAAARHIAGYLAKYVTKSATDLGVSPRRTPAPGIELLDVSDHVRELLRTLVMLAETVSDYEGMLDWLHTLGYRGHTTSKSRRYSTTMGALRDKHTRHERAGHADEQADDTIWDFARSGHKNTGDRYLAVSAALKHNDELWAARQLGDISTPFASLPDLASDGAR
jgi:8-oxo-dGTP pyrophosphatase MutT (NUDIX family)